MVMISDEEKREYDELAAERDRTLATIRAQMKLQAQKAEDLAKEVRAAMIGGGKLGVAIVDQASAARALKLAEFWES